MRLNSLPLYRSVLNSILLLIIGCASAPSTFYYQINFRNREDGQSAAVVDYRVEANGKVLSRANTSYGPYLNGGNWINGPRPTLIYVRWRDTATGAEFQRSADIGAALSDENLESETLYLMFHGEHLSIYLISNRPRPADEPLIGPSYTSYLSRRLIYTN